jgi:hypothetical protein
MAKPPKNQLPPLTIDALLADRKVNGSTCTLYDFLHTLSHKDRQAVRLSIKDPRVSIQAIHRALVARGYTYTHQVIARHRHQGCRRCPA